MERHAKFSFHKTGNCRWARIAAGVSGADRVILEWQRDEVAAAGAGQAVPLLSIAFPTNHLSIPKSKEKKQLSWIDPAPKGQAVLIEIFVTHENEPDIDRLLAITGERRLLYYKILRNGLRFCATTAQFGCGPVDVNLPATTASGAVFGEMRFPDYDGNNTGRPVRLVIMTGKTLPPMVWELGGYEVTKVNPR